VLSVWRKRFHERGSRDLIVTTQRYGRISDDTVRREVGRLEMVGG
jgi:hypothetical protein